MPHPRIGRTPIKTPRRLGRSIFRGLRGPVAVLVTLLALGFDLGAAAAAGDVPRMGLDGDAATVAQKPTALIAFGSDTLTAEVARTQEERAQGLMYREELAEDAGMLFIFPDNAVRGFWMQNTYIPLDIAFLDPSFRVVDIQQMEPMTTEQHTGRAPFTYALEVNQGWFEAHGVQIGDVAQVTFNPGE